MKNKEFLDLHGTHNPNRWYLPVVPAISVGPPGKLFLFGGAGLAASIMAMERSVNRPVIWATAQYLSYANPPSIVDLDVIVPAHGKYNTQARVVGHVGDREIFTVNAALGTRPNELSAQWSKMPDAPSPADCDARPLRPGQENSLHGRFDLRVAQGRYAPEDRDGTLDDDGQVLLWARPKESIGFSTAMLAVIADFVPSAIGSAIGKMAGGNSLDNTIRIRKLVETEWVLCDIRIHGIHGGFAHGRMLIFSQDGELIATASQSAIVRIRE